MKERLKPMHWFNHVSEYNSFSEFKKDIIRFLNEFSFHEILEDSFNFACHNGYSKKKQKVQIRAINKVFDQVYGKEQVRWGYIYGCSKEDLFWGPYIVIDEETFFYYPNNKEKLDHFIKKRLKNVSNSKANF